MRSLAAAVGLVLLGGCSKGGETPGPARSEVARPVAEPHVPVAPPTAPASGTLTGQVSALRGDVSALDMRVTDLGTVIDLPADALFEYDKAVLTSAAETQLRKAADVIRRSPGDAAIRVVGHTDSNGGDAYNQRLSEARARTVADWFARQAGVRQRSFAVVGKGESEPAAPNAAADGQDDPAGRAKNRRVEVIIPKS